MMIMSEHSNLFSQDDFQRIEFLFNQDKEIYRYIAKKHDVRWQGNDIHDDAEQDAIMFAVANAMLFPLLRECWTCRLLSFWRHSFIHNCFRECRS